MEKMPENPNDWTTLSIRIGIRDRLKEIRDDIHKNDHKEFGYSDVIDKLIKLVDKILDNKGTIGQFIVTNLDELV